MKVEINKDSCIGCGLCINLCSECFAMNETEGKAEIRKENGCSSCDPRNIASNCPVGAISVTDAIEEHSE